MTNSYSDGPRVLMVDGNELRVVRGYNDGDGVDFRDENTDEIVRPEFMYRVKEVKKDDYG